MLTEKETLIRQKLEGVFNELGREKARDIAFHMTDWLSDLEEIHQMFSRIDEVNHSEVETFIYRFLAHVPNHLVAAKKLSGMGSTNDIFNVGIFEDDNQ